MAEEILINFTPMETRVAVIENGMPQEIYVERASRRGIVGNIYKGKVVRVLPGMQAAFVDIGLERAAFIPVDEVIDATSGTPGVRHNISIADVIKEGDTLLVQVTKDPIGTKGARLTTHLSIPSRYLVLMPGNPHIGISQRIDDSDERERLRQIMEVLSSVENPDYKGGDSGFILRTVAEGVSETELRSDLNFLLRLWTRLNEKIAKLSAPSVVYEDLPLHMRALRDMAHSGGDRILIESRENYQRSVEFAQSLVHEIVEKLE